MSLIKTPNGDIDADDLTAPLPSRVFRDAWRLDGTVIVLDPVAKNEVLKKAIKAEAQRRIMGLMGAHDLSHCIIKQLNANKTAVALNDKRLRGETLTSEEEATAQALRDLADIVDAIRAVSDALEVQDPIPEDYTDSKHWPAGT